MLKKIKNNSSNVNELLSSKCVCRISVHLILLGFKRKSLEIIRLIMRYHIKNKLNRKYKKTINFFEPNYLETSTEYKDIIWFCWFQGIDNAPELVKKCYSSIVNNCPNKTIVVITEENYLDYVVFPIHINEKIEKGIITRTHLSDLLRIELLTKYGGTWIDATVYCASDNIPSYTFESDLFMFQNLSPGTGGESLNVSSWFMTAKVNNPVISLTRELLYSYWKTNNKMISYFLLHFFIEIALDYYPEQRSKMIPVSNAMPHVILLRMNEEYDRVLWDEVTRITPFHKLSYKIEVSKVTSNKTYYEKIMEE